MTASLPPSNVRDRLKRDHLTGGMLALLVQAGFLLLALSPSHSTRPASQARETLLFFPPPTVPARKAAGRHCWCCCRMRPHANAH